jgi:hypothetical protein
VSQRRGLRKIGTSIDVICVAPKTPSSNRIGVSFSGTALIARWIHMKKRNIETLGMTSLEVKPIAGNVPVAVGALP